MKVDVTGWERKYFRTDRIHEDREVEVYYAPLVVMLVMDPDGPARFIYASNATLSWDYQIETNTAEQTFTNHVNRYAWSSNGPTRIPVSSAGTSQP